MQFFLNLLCLGRNLCSKSNNLTNLGPAYQHNIDHFAPYGADQSGVRDFTRAIFIGCEDGAVNQTKSGQKCVKIGQELYVFSSSLPKRGWKINWRSVLQHIYLKWEIHITSIVVICLQKHWLEQTHKLLKDGTSDFQKAKYQNVSD